MKAIVVESQTQLFENGGVIFSAPILGDLIAYGSVA
jgi:hypothetical protein